MNVEPSYPIEPPDDDPRFTLGLTLDVAATLRNWGYPGMTADDLVRLQLALHRFIYKSD